MKSEAKNIKVKILPTACGENVKDGIKIEFLFSTKTGLGCTNWAEQQVHNESNKRSLSLNPFKPSGAKWLHYKVFKAILV